MGTFPARAAQAAQPGDHPHPFRSVAARTLLTLPAIEQTDGLCPAATSTSVEYKRHGPCASACLGIHLQHTHSPDFQGNLGVLQKAHWTQAPLMTSALSKLQDYDGLLGQLQEEYSALFSHRVCLVKMLVVASRASSGFSPLPLG